MDRIKVPAFENLQVDGRVETNIPLLLKSHPQQVSELVWLGFKMILQTSLNFALSTGSELPHAHILGELLQTYLRQLIKDRGIYPMEALQLVYDSGLTGRQHPLAHAVLDISERA